MTNIFTSKVILIFVTVDQKQCMFLLATLYINLRIFWCLADIVVSGQKHFFKASSDKDQENWIEQLQDASRITVIPAHSPADYEYS